MKHRSFCYKFLPENNKPVQFLAAIFFIVSILSLAHCSSSQKYETPTIELTQDSSFDGMHTIVRFTAHVSGNQSSYNYVWDMPPYIDCVSVSTDKHELWIVCDKIQTITGTVRALPSSGNSILSASVTLNIMQEAWPPLAKSKDAAQIWLTLGSEHSWFAANGPARISKAGSGTLSSLTELVRIKNWYIYHVGLPGFYQIKISGKAPQICNLFVSPQTSQHNERWDHDWYLTQWNTETTSNCGPAVAAMFVQWVKGIKTEVLDIRSYVGWKGNGAVDPHELGAAIASYGVQSKIRNLESAHDIINILARGHLLAVCYDMAGIHSSQNPAFDIYGQYYADHGGHYLALKGFSLDRRWVIVYDPIPSDWQENRYRYADGVSMFGKNRYYPIDELWSALRTHEALEVWR